MTGWRFIICLTLASCAPLPPASTVLAPLHRKAAGISGFPDRAGSFLRVAWEFDARSITAHYRSADGVTTAWLSLFICEPEEQDPLAYIAPQRLVAGLESASAGVSEVQSRSESMNGQSFNVVTFAGTEAGGMFRGVIAGGVIGPSDGKYQILLVRAGRPGAEPIDFELIRPLIEPTGE